MALVLVSIGFILILGSCVLCLTTSTLFLQLPSISLSGTLVQFCNYLVEVLLTTYNRCGQDLINRGLLLIDEGNRW